ncbi:MAG: PilC/PilY family type IV pilus protein, partial [Gammaproteobacteria bacterium]|nr:PilC/PilY family type IV pilus protein [Gammaproteobacteria bacterium]
NVTSYFITSRDSQLLHDLADAGGSGVPHELTEDPEDLVTTLEDILQSILSVSSTFVPVSLPVNAFNRAEVIDNVFLALFEAQAEGRPLWSGNLKKLRLDSADEAGQIDLIDALGRNAVAIDGRLRNDALTFWTDPDSLPAPDPEKSEVEGRDGRSVSRGGAGQQTPGFVSGGPGATNQPGSRILYFDSGPAALAPFNANPATATVLEGALEAADKDEAEDLIAFARGMDIDDLDGDSDTAEARPWLLADPLHSRPEAINYGARDGHSAENPLIYVAVGTNDGYMHFIRNTASTGEQLGREAWAFMPREVMGIVKPLRENAPGLKHPYGTDGVPVVFKGDYNGNGTIESGEHVLLVFGLRRGGKAYYGVDVSDPLNPQLRWTITKGGDFAELGLTFSTPRIAHVDAGDGTRPALIFAGGYDSNKDSRGTAGSDDSEGNAIFVIDMETGELIWKAIQGGGGSSATVFQHPDLVDSIPSDVTIADTDGDGLTDRVLVGDSGGNVWRADLAGSDSSDWKLTRLAALGRHLSSGKANDRRFFHRPDLVASRDEHGPFDAVILGSGDRADPKDQGGAVNNYIFMVKDRFVTAGSGQDTDISSFQLGDVTDNCLQDGSCTVPPELDHGWKLALERGGEKVLSSALTIAGTVYLTSYVPPGSGPTLQCGLAEGDGYLYALS